ncbi:DNA-binding transcriptional LysR family regulator [Pseudoduganella flava]|uniref:DNA-binding transcriptional LysR family regulator n=1 Tax=Pseudoduganella flava TaxID=871742 RepID=A0A562PGG1_9BURK|nr:LysR substrate-binding domain-containing protein [Pseudoduganella flava]QGZ40355.1 LysR family transcriptional regulator [Pseudoduganella flava]TWI43545.1 DNA-binding transcriptional LysR family regulator [Pseudoduganella flava]
MAHSLLNLPPLDALRGFVAAARRLSITAAAQDLCLTQSAVSRQIQALEERLGTALFVRGNRSIALTDAGRQLFDLTSPWLDELAILAATLKHDAAPQPVTISASIGVAALWVLPRLGAFQAAHPDVDIRMAASNRLMDLQRDGVDLAIRYAPPAAVPADALRLFDEEVAPVASPAVAAAAFATPDALARQVLLDLDDGGQRTFLHWSPWLQRHGLPHQPRATLRFNQYDQLIQAAVEGNGVALGRLALVLPLLKDGRLVAQMSRRMQSEYAYWLLQAAPEPRREVELVRAWLREQVALTAAHLAQLGGAAAA